MIETERDRLSMLRVLGETVRVGAVDLWAIFDHDYVLAGEVEQRVPTLTIRTSDAEAHCKAKGASVTVAGRVYRIRRHEPDGTGMSRLILEA
ncbi:MAG: hypothetical protein QG586_581 [Pseudomonadota bacterium]|nr:hypothetical protein [Pseudomonadota bacterium]